MKNDSYKLVSTSAQIGTFNVTKPKWRLNVGSGTFYIDRQNAPNWFHRKMQQIFFGFKWEKL